MDKFVVCSGKGFCTVITPDKNGGEPSVKTRPGFGKGQFTIETDEKDGSTKICEITAGPTVNGQVKAGPFKATVKTGGGVKIKIPNNPYIAPNSGGTEAHEDDVTTSNYFTPSQIMEISFEFDSDFDFKGGSKSISGAGIIDLFESEGFECKPPNN